ncbi:hypothetical protein IAR50_007430 [Cryptococcus sp. DSM 104548]
MDKVLRQLKKLPKSDPWDALILASQLRHVPLGVLALKNMLDLKYFLGMTTKISLRKCLLALEDDWDLRILESMYKTPTQIRMAQRWLYDSADNGILDQRVPAALLHEHYWPDLCGKLCEAINPNRKRGVRDDWSATALFDGMPKGIEGAQQMELE